MKASKIALAVAGAALFGGCNNNPVTLYGIQVDESALQNLPPQCFVNNTVPPTKDINPNERPEIIWQLWSSASIYYLDVGALGKGVPMGSADPVVVTGAITSTDGKVFDGKDTKQNLKGGANPPAGYSDSEVLEMNVQFQQTGGQPQGTINLTSAFTC